MSLTPAGEVLLREARAALDAVVAAERRTRRAAGVAAGGRAGLVLVSKAGAANELVAKLLDQYAAEPGAVDVDVLLVGPGQQEQALRDGRADVALLHAPWDDAAGFDTEVLQVEEAAVLVAAGHPLTGGGAVPAGDLDALVGLPAPRWPDREGRYAAGAGPEVHDVTQLLQLIALGRTYLVAPASARALAGEGSRPCRSSAHRRSPRCSPGPRRAGRPTSRRSSGSRRAPESVPRPDAGPGSAVPGGERGEVVEGAERLVGRRGLEHQRDLVDAGLGEPVDQLGVGRHAEGGEADVLPTLVGEPPTDPGDLLGGVPARGSQPSPRVASRRSAASLSPPT